MYISNMSQARKGVQIGSKRVGYTQLRQALEAERQGKELDFTDKQMPSWTLQD